MRGRKPEITPDCAALTSTTKPPLWLTKSAKAEWKRVLPIMIERQVLTAGDLASFASNCAAIGQMIDAQKIIAKDGMTFMGASGLKRHPATGILSE
jgi:P27 family predicted phage terminase small subunit